MLKDLSINYVERRIFLCGFAVNRLFTDYGIDLGMMTFTQTGEVENGSIFFQVKATDSPNILRDGKTISVRVDVADLKAWQEEWAPIILVLYDGQTDRAWWLYVQKYLDEKNVSLDDIGIDQDRVTIRIPNGNRLNQRAMERFRRFRDEVHRSIKGDTAGGR